MISRVEIDFFLEEVFSAVKSPPLFQSPALFYDANIAKVIPRMNPESP